MLSWFSPRAELFIEALRAVREGLHFQDCEALFSMLPSLTSRRICAVSFGRLSQLPRSAADIDTPAINARTESQSWRPYEDNDISNCSSAERPARTNLFKDQLSKLSELASDMVNTFYAPRERFTSRSLAATYANYQSWRQNLPEPFRLENTTLPHVLILHMYYYACVLQ
jgi:hypothetical protein